MKKNFYKQLVFLFLIFFNIYILPDNLDTTFGQGVGYNIIQNGTNNLTVNNLIVQSDSKIIASGTISNPNPQFFLQRYNIDGTLDTAFGTNGMVITQIGSNLSTSQLVYSLLQQDGKIVSCGFYYDNNVSTQIVIVRYNSNGSLDTNFGSSGIVKILVGTGCSPQDLTIDSNYNILVSGNSVVNGYPQIILVRYTSNGQLDNTFANSGILTTRIGYASNATNHIIDSSGNIYIAGSSGNGITSPQFMIAKYSSSGVLDTTFGNAGSIVTTINNFSQINKIAFDNNGNIIAAGYNTDSFNNSSVTLARYSSSGQLDTTFNSSGQIPGVLTQSFNKSSAAKSMVIDSNNNIIITGSSYTDKYGLLTARFNSSGVLDTTFGGNGYSILFLNNLTNGNFVTLQNDGKILISGYESDNNKNLFGIVARYTINNINKISISNIINGSTIKQKTITLNGTSSGNNSNVNLYIDGVFFSQEITDSQGNWPISIWSNILTEGQHYVQADLLDSNNNILVSNATYFTVDTSSVSSYSAGNLIRVDAIYGNDSTGLRNGSPFSTINGAISVALPGDTIQIAPGIYNENFTIPNFVSLRGLSSGTCIISQNVTTDTDLITMGEYCVLEDLTLQLNSSNHVQLRAIVFPGTTTITSALRGLRIRVDNSSASSSGSSNVYGIHATGSGVPQDPIFSAVEIAINVNSIGGGVKRGILVDSSAGFNMGISIVNVTGTGPGSFIGLETNNANAVIESLASIVQGSTADISQTLGILKIYNTDLDNLNANGLGITTCLTSGIISFADTGIVNSGIRYLRMGTTTATLLENPFHLSTRILVKAINVQLLSSPGVGNSVTVTLRKNQTDTAKSVTLSGSQITAFNISNSILFEAGDSMSVSVNGSAGNTASDIIVTLELY